MKTISLTINGRQVEAQSDQTILDVVRRHDIDTIPTLCHDPKLPPHGSCYLCVVEVEGMNKLIPSCASPVADGMVIHTQNERIREARKTALELLLSNHYADCLGPCKQTCPAGVDVQGYVALVALGRLDEAVNLVRETNPLPLVCSRVCVRECEIACRRNHVDDAVGVDFLKRYAVDMTMDHDFSLKIPEPNGKKIALIGGGPAGLTAAFYLVQKGYAITLYEKMPHLGGMLRYGIPEYRLPKEQLDKEIARITDAGVDVRVNMMLGRDFTLDQLLEEGNDAVFVGVGAHKAKSMQIPEEETTQGILGGIDFLREVENDRSTRMEGRVVVVGGGNTAIDAARTAVRLGATPVTMLYRRTRKEMPAHPAEIDAAIHEGVEIIYLSAPVSIISDENRRVKGLRCIRMELGPPDKSGRRSPVPVADSEYVLDCDYVVSAIGQDTDTVGLKNTDLKLSKWNTIDVNNDTMQTSIPNVFAGGDVVSGPAVAIDAIAMGKRAADAMHQFLTTGTVTPQKKEFLSRKDAFGEVVDDEFSEYEKIEREKMPELEAAERIRTFDEVELGFTDEQAMQEAFRCLECGCTEYFDCPLKAHATEYNVDVTHYIGEVRKYRVDRRHPLMTLDPNKCISCGRCIRTCSEILKVSALGFVYRGFRSIVKPAMEKALLDTNCITCGNCISTCPTGAIAERLPYTKPGPWKATLHRSTCSFCSVGCQIDYKVYYDEMFSVTNTDEHTHNKGYLCMKGRFAYPWMQLPDRAVEPAVKTDGALATASWEQALDHAAQRLSDVVARHGLHSVAVLASPTMTNEEHYLLQKLARAGLRSNIVGSFDSLVNGMERQTLDPMFGATVSTATMDDLAIADVILVVNANPMEDNLIAELKLKAAMKHGAKLVVLSSHESELAKLADLWLDPRRGTGAALISGITRALIDRGAVNKGWIDANTTGYEAFEQASRPWSPDFTADITGVDATTLADVVGLLEKDSVNLAVVYSLDTLWEKSRHDLEAIGNLLLATGRVGRPGNGVIILRDFANSQGMMDMGMDASRLPGHVAMGNLDGISRLASLWKAELGEIFTPMDTLAQLENGTVKAAIVFGEDPLLAPENARFFSNLEFLLVADHLRTATSERADVFLPLATPVENVGTMTACDRRIQAVRPVFLPRNGRTNWDVIASLYQRLVPGQFYATVDDVAAEIRQAVPWYSLTEGQAFWPFEAVATAPFAFAQFEIDVTPVSKDVTHYLTAERYFETVVRRKVEAQQ
jgi:formate dehydrogenase major subunit